MTPTISKNLHYVIIFQHIPLVVETCAGIVETRGLENQGIYRVPGNTSVVNFLQAELDRVRFIYTYVPVHIYTIILYTK